MGIILIVFGLTTLFLCLRSKEAQDAGGIIIAIISIAIGLLLIDSNTPENKIRFENYRMKQAIQEHEEKLNAMEENHRLKKELEKLQIKQ